MNNQRKTYRPLAIGKQTVREPQFETKVSSPMFVSTARHSVNRITVK